MPEEGVWGWVCSCWLVFLSCDSFVVSSLFCGYFHGLGWGWGCSCVWFFRFVGVVLARVLVVFGLILVLVWASVFGCMCFVGGGLASGFLLFVWLVFCRVLPVFSCCFVFVFFVGFLSFLFLCCGFFCMFLVLFLCIVGRFFCIFYLGGFWCGTGLLVCGVSVCFFLVIRGLFGFGWCVALGVF